MQFALSPIRSLIIVLVSRHCTWKAERETFGLDHLSEERGPIQNQTKYTD